jgi:hypothetical protein
MWLSVAHRCDHHHKLPQAHGARAPYPAFSHTPKPMNQDVTPGAGMAKQLPYIISTTLLCDCVNIEYTWENLMMEKLNAVLSQRVTK